MLLKLLSLIRSVIEIAEELYEDGQEKKKAVMEAVEDFCMNVGIDFDKIKTAVSITIDTIVFIYNIKGIFTHKKGAKN